MPLTQSVLRYLILYLYIGDFNLTRHVFPSDGVQTSLLHPVFGFALQSLIGLLAVMIVLLYIFNQTTRQSLHDLAVGSYVVQANFQGEAAWLIEQD